MLPRTTAYLFDGALTLTGFVCDVYVKIGLAALAWQANMVLIFFSHDREAGAASAALASSLGQFCPYPGSSVCHG